MWHLLTPFQWDSLFLSSLLGHSPYGSVAHISAPDFPLTVFPKCPVIILLLFLFLFFLQASDFLGAG